MGLWGTLIPLRALFFCENHKSIWFRFLVAGDDSVSALMRAIISETIIDGT